MPYQIDILKAALEDIQAGIAFYKQADAAAAELFYNEIFTDIERLEVYAAIHEKHYGYFRALSRRFPYAIYYDVMDVRIIIVAVLPMRRDSAWIEKRLGG